MIRVADVVMRFVAAQGVRDVFTVSGGGIMHLVDAIGVAAGIRYRINNHEQASAIAAEAYARVTGGLGVCVVTTGPGSTNALSALAGAYVDSVPVLCVSGQVRKDFIADYSRQRQYGPQEINIIDMARPVTKYATTVMDPQSILAELELATAYALGGRPGPVWLNIPLDIQGAMVDETLLRHAPSDLLTDVRPAASCEEIEITAKMLAAASRPILIAGNGVHLAHAEDELREFAATAKTPVLLTIGAMDLLPEDDPWYMGKFGPVGQRRANFALQNADLVISIGASMSVSSIGFNTAEFAPRAQRIMVNIDDADLDKGNYRPDVKIHSDAKYFFSELLPLVRGRNIVPSLRWIDACARWKERYPLVGDEHRTDPGYVSSYVFVDAISDLLRAGDIVLTGNSLDAATVYQAFKVKRGQRVFTNVNFGAMGWDLPAAVGAASAASAGARTVLVTGDGSLQFNVQELMTVAVNAYDLKIFVLNNDGYESIRSTQTNYFESRFVGSDFGSGIGNPDFEKLAAAYGIGYARIDDEAGIVATTRRALEATGPQLIELRVSPTQGRIPKLSSFRRADGTMESKPLHDMFPFLPAEEIAENMSLFDDQPAGRT